MGLGLDSPSHWVVIAALALLLFGYKKLPDMARSAGKSLRIFKTEMKGMADDDDARLVAKDSGPARQVQAAPPAPAAAPPAPATTTHPSAAELPGPHGEITVAQAPAPVTAAAVAPHEAVTESAPPRPA